MSMHSHSIRVCVVLSLAALGLVSGTTVAAAQDSGGSASPSPQYQPGAPEDVYVRAPHPAPRRSTIGAPIEDISISQPVRFDDLDLRTEWGADALRKRVLATARRLCSQLDSRYPANFYPPTSDSPPCFPVARDIGLSQADDAIARARGYNP